MLFGALAEPLRGSELFRHWTQGSSFLATLTCCLVCSMRFFLCAFHD